METKICPYPGLRPFTEEEAIFFKGRDKHIHKIMDELSVCKFLMVTGASGDGKSSLIYAGLLPNVRAGFFKGFFPGWAVGVFRPGNSPLKMLSEALVTAMPEKTIDTINSNLTYGYSALIDEYKNSSLYLDTNSPEFLSLDEKEQKKRKRSASNLLIVVDQFEEFFTNDKNFNKETAIPSVEAQLVMNLLIETANVAKKQNIPIYIVCTMRSDYIGNAPAFRGLPELIGDNQFFVPRLNRDEIQKVIVEPADLSGCKLSFRFVQRLINDLDVINTDVLPSLQHALRQVWNFANQRNEELDLLHYAMAGGINSDELPADIKQKFADWFLDLPEYYQNIILKQQETLKSSTGIGNVLNLHANILFETAHLYAVGSQQSAGNSLYPSPSERVGERSNNGLQTIIDKAASQKVLKKAFQCLTQIDDSKAVRHRITLEQMTAIIGEEGFNTVKVCNLLNIFREQGNTMIYPFISESSTVGNLSPPPKERVGERSNNKQLTIDNKQLNPSTLLDITHEALIRNWKLLGKWTKEEHDSSEIYREIDSFVERWNKNNKEKKYLLPEGNYDYFEQWHIKQEPSVAWISRYVVQEIYVTDGRATKLIEGQEKILEKEQQKLALEKQQLIKEFLQQSKENILAIIKRRKMVLTAITSLCAVAIIGLVFALYLRKQAINLKNEIERTAHSTQIATTAYTTLEKDPTLAFRLAEQAYQIEPTPLAGQVLMAAYGEMPFYKKLVGHTDGLRNAKYSPDGKYIVTGAKDSDFRLWDNEGNFLYLLKGHTAPLPNGDATINFSNDSKYIITCSYDSTARLWNLEGKCLAILKHRGAVNSACFSPISNPQTLSGASHTDRSSQSPMTNGSMTNDKAVIASGKTPLERAPQKEMTIKISNWLFSLISLFYNLLNFVKFYTV